MTKYTNPMIIQKDTSPYMYLTEFSGIYLNNYPSVSRGIKILVNEAQASVHYLVSFQIWFRYPKTTFDSTMTIASVNYNGGSVDFTITPMSDPTKARLTASVPVSLHKNGNLCSSYIVYAGEWNSLYVIFEDAVDFASFTGDITLYPNFVFNNIAQYVYENPIDTIVVATNLNWGRVYEPTALTTNTWQDILDAGTWYDAVSDFSTKSSYTLSGDYIYGNQVGTSVLVNDDVSTLNAHSNGADIFTDVEWQKIEKTLV